MPLTARVAVWDATIYYDKLYTYTVPAPLEGHIFVGSMVLVPFGRGRARPRTGVVLAVEQAEKVDGRVKALYDAAPEEARLTDELLSIVKYLKQATFCTWYEAVKAVLPRGAQYRAVEEADGWKLRPTLRRHTEPVYTLAGGVDPAAETAADGKRLTEKQKAVLQGLADGPLSRADLLAATETTRAVADGLVRRGLLTLGEQDRSVLLAEDVHAPSSKGEGNAPPALSPAQKAVCDKLKMRMEGNAFKPALLHGVTGSGKTMVFLDLVQAALDQGKSALVLVPEIGLTPQMLGQLRRRFGGQVAVQHSGLTNTARLLQWRAIQRGEARVVVGTRSAVFAPLEDIGLIVVDEEQERSYQSESAPRYDALEVARRRASHHGALLLLASATPAVTDYYLARQGRYELLRLDERYGNLPLPAVELVDMREEMNAGNPGIISRALAEGIGEAMAAGNQVILLLNRRGYHRVGVCRSCGAAVKCEDCSVPMVFHRPRRGSCRGNVSAGVGQENKAAVRFSQSENAGDAGEDSVPVVFHRPRRGEYRQGAAGQAGEQVEAETDAGFDPASGRLMCHYCGKTVAPAPSVCPDCGGEIRYTGFGTQRMEQELAERFPAARILRMDLDSTGRRGAHAAMLARFGRGEYDILLGTQMVAKGLDFERVSLVGVVGIDSLLFSQGYRAYETVFSLVTQVVGRSGRAGRQGKAMIQTMDVGNPVLGLAASQDYDAFYEQEIAFRRMQLYPPFCTICVAAFAAGSEAEGLQTARRFAAILTEQARRRPDIPLRILGPAPMSLAMLGGVYRFRLTLKCRNDEAFRSLMQRVLEQYGKENLPRKATVWLDFHSDAGG